MTCCNNTLNLGCVNFCDEVETGVTAPATDTYTIEVLGGNRFEFDFNMGDEIAFANPFNEDSITQFTISRSGTQITSGGYDCWKVLTFAGVNLDAPEVAANNGATCDTCLKRVTFTTDGAGAATVGSIIGMNVDLWTYESGTQGVLLGTADYTYNSATGAFSGLDALKKYLAYAY